jgi:hypothetical protein
MEYIILDENMLIHIIINIANEYEAITNQTEMDNEFNELSLKDVKNRFRTKMRKKNKSRDSDETALFGGKFKGHCNFCGKYGH